MSQATDYTIANASGAAVRSDLNTVLGAVATNNSGTSAPGSQPFMMWIDTTDNLIKMRNGADDGWITLPLAMNASNQTAGNLSLGAASGSDRTLTINSAGTNYFSILPTNASDKVTITAGNTGSDSNSMEFFVTPSSGTETKAMTIESDGVIKIEDTSAPGTTTNRLYSVSGDIYWDGNQLNSVTDDFPLLAPAGSASAPSYSFSGDANTGIYQVSADSVGIATGGTVGITLDSSQNTAFAGAIDVTGTANLDVVDIDGAVDMASTLAVAGVLTGASLDISGDIDIDGTANLDIVDIDGAVDMASTLAVAGAVTFNDAGADVDFRVESNDNANMLFVDGGANNVGIGTAAPDITGFGSGTNGLEIADATLAGIRLNGNAADSMYFVSGSAAHWLYGKGAVPMTFSTNGSEAMRIDSSGNVLVGKTAVSLGTVGIEVKPFGEVRATASGAQALQLNRLASDGTIADFRKDGTTVGSIGTNTSGLYIADAGVGFRFDSGGTDDIIPCNATGGAADASINLGSSGARFKDLYLSGGAYLGGTAATNKLDDYEEGTWTPTIATGTSSGKNGSYTKVGNKVNFWFNMIGFSDLTTSANVIIGGLPFVSNVVYGTVGSAMTEYCDVPSHNLYTGSGVSTMTLYGNTTTVWVQLKHADFNNAGAQIYGSGSYTTDS